MKQRGICRVWNVCAGKGRKQLCKKVFAVSLSIATAASLLPANLSAVSAAAKPYVSMRTTFKTLHQRKKEETRGMIFKTRYDF